MRTTSIGLIAMLLATATAVRAQSQTDTRLAAGAHKQVIEALTAELKRAYVFPDKSELMERDLKARLDRGEYDAIKDAAAFARVLTEHLQGITHDKHLRVGVTPKAAGVGVLPGAGSRREPFGQTRRLVGNVAYIEILSFGFSADQVRADVRTVMSAAADADALILDVRANGGGRPDMVALVSSYVFGSDSVHLNSLYWRPQNRTDHFYTNPRVEGTKFGPTKPVYVLTSARTFSAAEEFTYNLQALKRATIVGERTGGGAHPGGGVTLAHGLQAFIPSGRAINPITKTNWEGTGVVPEVAVPAANALESAHKLAREALRLRKSVR